MCLMGACDTAGRRYELRGVTVSLSYSLLYQTSPTPQMSCSPAWRHQLQGVEALIRAWAPVLSLRCQSVDAAAATLSELLHLLMTRPRRRRAAQAPQREHLVVGGSGSSSKAAETNDWRLLIKCPGGGPHLVGETPHAPCPPTRAHPGPPSGGASTTVLFTRRVHHQ